MNEIHPNRYVLTVELPHADGYIRLRRALKAMLRRLGIRVLDIRAAGAPGAGDDGEDAAGEQLPKAGSRQASCYSREGTRGT